MRSALGGKRTIAFPAVRGSFPYMWGGNDPDQIKARTVGSVALLVAVAGGALIASSDLEASSGILKAVAGCTLIVGAVIGFRAFLVRL